MIFRQLKNSMTPPHITFIWFPWPVIFHDFPGLKNSVLKFHDFPRCVGTLKRTRSSVKYNIACHSLLTFTRRHYQNFTVFIRPSDLDFDPLFNGVICEPLTTFCESRTTTDATVLPSHKHTPAKTINQSINQSFIEYCSIRCWITQTHT